LNFLLQLIEFSWTDWLISYSSDRSQNISFLIRLDTSILRHARSFGRSWWCVFVHSLVHKIMQYTWYLGKCLKSSDHEHFRQSCNVELRLGDDLDGNLTRNYRNRWNCFRVIRSTPLSSIAEFVRDSHRLYCIG
jgi:hypothetical protein